MPTSAVEKSGEPAFKFEAGPSLYSGLSQAASPNPLKHIYQMIGEEPEWINYDTWGAHLPECPEGYELSIGAENFHGDPRRYGGPTAIDDWNRLADELRPLTKGVTALPSTAVRGDAGVLLTLGLRYPKAFIDVIANAQKITAPFNLDSYGVQDAFLKNYLDLIAFLLQGLPVERHAHRRDGLHGRRVLQARRRDGLSQGRLGRHRRGVRARRHQARRLLGAHVDARRADPRRGRPRDRRAHKGGKRRCARARRSSPTPTCTTPSGLVPRGACAGFDDERDALLAPAAPVYYDDAGAGVAAGGVGAPLCKSFMHLHLGVKADALPADLPPQWTVVNDWNVPIDAPGNVIVVSVPSLPRPVDLAPEGHHVIHAYTAGNEPFSVWEKFDSKEYRNDPEYLKLKEERAAPMWEAIKRRAPDVEAGIVVRQVGTPLTTRASSAATAATTASRSPPAARSSSPR